MKTTLILSILTCFIFSTKVVASTPCVERGCFCKIGKDGGDIDIGCYSEPDRCCPGEAPQHIKDKAKEEKRKREARIDVLNVPRGFEDLYQCLKDDSDPDLLRCKGGLYRKVSSEDANSLPDRLRDKIQNDSSREFKDNNNKESSGTKSKNPNATER